MSSTGAGWITVGSSPVLHAEFTTHANYLSYISERSVDLCVQVSTNPVLSQNSLPSLAVNKVKLARLTMNNIDSEMDQINKFMDYAQICSSWIPVKSYYLFFNLLMILEWLTDDNLAWLSGSHEEVNRQLKELIRNKLIVFSEPSFNTIIPAVRVATWKIPSGSNIVIGNPDPKIRQRQVLKKILDYKKDEYKRRNDLKRLVGIQKHNFFSRTDLNLWEFLYWYRIKANYRDMEFLDSGVNINDFFYYYLNYHTLSSNIFKALTSEINRLSTLKYTVNLF